jgi:hypothetical protein
MKLIMIIIVMVATSCATSHSSGCNYAKAQKYNAKQMRKANRYYASRR